MNKSNEKHLWKRPVENPVENVENLWVSTAILLFWQQARQMHKMLYKHGGSRWPIALCCRRTLEKIEEKPAKKCLLQQSYLQNPGVLSRNRENFCEKAPKTVRYDFTTGGNT